jgi:uncharacterized protein
LILVDTSGLLAALVDSQPRHPEARAALEQEERPFVLSPFVLAELDYFVSKYRGARAAATLLGEVARNAYLLAEFTNTDVAKAADVVAAHSDLGIGLADASIVVLAGRHGTDRVLTLDERHFRALRTPSGAPFTILPADAAR